MAASVKNMRGVSQDSSTSSDDEVLKRCQEAVWDTRPVKKDDNNVKQSKRSQSIKKNINSPIVLMAPQTLYNTDFKPFTPSCTFVRCKYVNVVVADHEHDGNELQVSQGFRTHVAKKLGHLLDSYISETQTESFCVESAKCEDASDEGFRLFSTSVPRETTEEPLPPVRRRPVQSSSDSDSEMESRLREAAVSVKDLLPSLTLPSTQSPTSSESEKQKKKKKRKKKNAEGEEGDDGSAVKKKKTRRQDQEEDAQVDLTTSAHNNCGQENSELEHTQVKVKQKKKKKREGNMTEGASS